MTFFLSWRNDNDDDVSVEEDFSLTSPCGSFDRTGELPFGGFETFVSQFLTGTETLLPQQGVIQSDRTAESTSERQVVGRSFQNFFPRQPQLPSLTDEENVPYRDLPEPSGPPQPSQPISHVAIEPTEGDLNLAPTPSTESSDSDSAPFQEKVDEEQEVSTSNVDVETKAEVNPHEDGCAVQSPPLHEDGCAVQSPPLHEEGYNVWPPPPRTPYHTDPFCFVKQEKEISPSFEVSKPTMLEQHPTSVMEEHKHLLQKLTFAVHIDTTSEEFISLTKDRRNVKPREHFACLSYGSILTFAAVLSCLLGLILATLSKRSGQFVYLNEPLRISPHLNHINHVGLVDMELCYNESAVIIDPALDGIAFLLNDTNSYETVRQTGCYKFHLGPEVVDDKMWNVARVFLSIAIAIGSFFTLMLCTSMFWESINLKPIATGLLVTYFCQSLSFFFFDSDLCRRHSCSLSQGSILSIVSSIFWFTAGLVCIRMDVVYQGKQRLLQKRYRRARRQEYRRLKRELYMSRFMEDAGSVQETLPSALSTPASTPPKVRLVEQLEQEVKSTPEDVSALRINFSEPSVAPSELEGGKVA